MITIKKIFFVRPSHFSLHACRSEWKEKKKKQVDGESIGKSFSWTAAVVLLKNDDLKKSCETTLWVKIVCVFFCGHLVSWSTL